MKKFFVAMVFGVLLIAGTTVANHYMADSSVVAAYPNGD
jgi:hypothetical protein